MKKMKAIDRLSFGSESDHAEGDRECNYNNREILKGLYWEGIERRMVSHPFIYRVNLSNLNHKKVK